MTGKKRVYDLFKNREEIYLHKDEQVDKYSGPGGIFTRKELDEYKEKYPWKMISIISIVRTES